MVPAVGADYERRVKLARAAVARTIDAWPDTELFERARQVEKVLADPGFVVIRELMESRRSDLVDRAVHGPLLEKPEYAALTGRLSGFDEALFVGDAIVQTARVREARAEAENGDG